MNKNDWQEHDVAKALEAFQPQPSGRFYQRMQREPWMAQPMTILTRVAPKRAPNRRWILVMGLLATLFIVGTVLVTPPLRALAQEMLELFARAPKDEITGQELEANVPPVDSWQRELSQMQAEQLAGFDIWVPHQLPFGYRFNQAAYLSMEQMVISFYSVADAPMVDPRLHTNFVLAQQPATYADRSNRMFPVGTSAVIETVQLGDVQGAYVEGVWCGTSSDSETLQWCPLPKQGILRWQRDEWVFTLDGAGSITREQMIELATNLVPLQE